MKPLTEGEHEGINEALVQARRLVSRAQAGERSMNREAVLAALRDLESLARYARQALE